jgi:autotransporter-associated beta strand protein
MRTYLARIVASFAVLFLAAPADAQIVWNVTYADGNIGSGGIGFADPTVSGSTTVGQLRRDSVTAALDYLGKQLDGRGTVNLKFLTSQSDGTGFLAQFGANKFVTSATSTSLPGSFQNGGVYQAARTNSTPFAGSDGQGTFDFGYQYNYAGQTPNSSNYDMVTVAIHEVTHSLGFLSLFNSTGTGQGLASSTLGTPDTYSAFAKQLQRGNGIGGSLFNTTITSSNFGSFTGDVSTLTNENNTSTGLFFGGQYAREVYGGAVPIYAPTTFASGSSTSHVSDSNAVMNMNISPNTEKRYQRYEIAMLMDIGWNVYNWKSGNGNWRDGVTTVVNPDDTLNVANSKWLTDSGIVFSNGTPYNLNSNQAQAPVLPPYGQVTSNIILNFGGTGSTAYTSSNDLGDIRISRLNLNSTASVTNTINNAASNATGTLIFGVNSDGTSSVLTPKIVQQNTGAFNLNTNIQIKNTTAALGGGWEGLTVDGSGTGQVNLGGIISGDGTLTKAGAFTLQLNGSTANTFTGLTTVQAGTLLLNKTAGQNAIGGNLTIAGGTVELGAANQLPDSAKVTLSGGTLKTNGNSETVGKFDMTAASTIALGSGSHTLQFTDFNDETLDGVLTVTGWSGTLGTVGTSNGRIVISGVTGDPNATYSTWLSTVAFQNFGGGGAMFISTGSGVYELVPVPEPATVLAVAFGALGFGAAVRRRWRKSVAEHAIAP